MKAVEKQVGELAVLVGGRVAGEPSFVVSSAAPVEEAGPCDVTFAADGKHLKLLKDSRAGAVILKDGELPDWLSGRNLILVKNPHLAFAKVLEVLRPSWRPAPGVHPGASVHKDAVLGREVSVGAFAVIEEGARIGDRAVIHPGAYVGRGAGVGEDAVIYSGVAIREGCRVGKRVIIHCNSVIGSDGFGYARDGSSYYKIPQTGIVRVEDDVEIGACATVDRATLGETVIGRGTKIDNLVQIAHNVKIGADSIIVAQVGIAGSVTVGRGVQLGGQAGLAGHIEIGDGAMIGAQSGVAGDIPRSTVYSGSPAIPHTEWLRAANVFARLPEMKKRLGELEKRVEAMEAGKDGKK